MAKQQAQDKREVYEVTADQAARAAGGHLGVLRRRVGALEAGQARLETDYKDADNAVARNAAETVRRLRGEYEGTRDDHSKRIDGVEERGRKYAENQATSAREASGAYTDEQIAAQRNYVDGELSRLGKELDDGVSGVRDLLETGTQRLASLSSDVTTTKEDLRREMVGLLETVDARLGSYGTDVRNALAATEQTLGQRYTDLHREVQGVKSAITRLSTTLLGELAEVPSEQQPEPPQPKNEGSE